MYRETESYSIMKKERSKNKQKPSWYYPLIVLIGIYAGAGTINILRLVF